MIRPLDKDASGYDLCIIGAGPAGLTIAAELAYSGLKICVLESGKEKRTAFADALKELQSEGLPIKANSRERIVGGASTVWGGLSAPLDAVDLEHWPIAAHELDKYLDKTVRYRFPSLDDFKAPRGWQLPNLTDKVFVALRPAYNFAALRPVFDREGVDLFVGATVVQLKSAGGRIEEIICKTQEGTSVRISAKVFVLAAGGIENPRLLLASNVGNERDQVGRYFMNHPKGYAGLLRLAAPLPAESPYLPRTAGGRMLYAGLRLSDEFQKSRGLLNSCVQFEPNLGVMQRYSFAVWRRLPQSLSNALMLLRPRTLRPRWFADMEPRPDNRVTLSDKPDAFGTPLPKVQYGLSDRDKETFRALHASLKESVKNAGVGVLEGSAEEIIVAVTQDASHHLGGTRMGQDPAHSVVDSDCKVHSLANLYLAGGSVFPTGGCANPTMTIVALAIRLAGHLQNVLGAKEAPLAHPAEGKKILIIGAGKRVTTDVLPALESLAGRLSIAGVYARHAGALAGSRGRYEVAPLADLSAEKIKGAQFVYLAVPPEAIEGIIKSLPPVSSDTELIIDTPVPLSNGAQAQCKKFKRVHVAEDSVALPWLALFAGQEVKTIECAQSVYRYHGIALVKALAGGRVRFAWRWGKVIRVRAGGARIKIIEPRDYARGRLLINGAEPELLLKNNQCVGFKLRDERLALSADESRLAGFMEQGDTIVSRMLEFKRVGLARLLDEIAIGKEPYSLAEGANDARVDRAVHRFWAYSA